MKKQHVTNETGHEEPLDIAVAEAVNQTLHTVLDVSCADVQQAGEAIYEEFVKISGITRDFGASVGQLIGHFDEIQLGQKQVSFDQFCMYLNSTLALAVEKNILATHTLQHSTGYLNEVVYRLSFLQQELQESKKQVEPAHAAGVILECVYELKQVIEALTQTKLSDEDKNLFLKDMTTIEEFARVAPARTAEFTNILKKTSDMNDKINAICSQIMILMQFQDRQAQIVSNLKAIVSRYHAFVKTGVKMQDYETAQAHAVLLKQDIKMSAIRRIFEQHLNDLPVDVSGVEIAGDAHDEASTELF